MKRGSRDMVGAGGALEGGQRQPKTPRFNSFGLVADGGANSKAKVAEGFALVAAELQGERATSMEVRAQIHAEAARMVENVHAHIQTADGAALHGAGGVTREREQRGGGGKSSASREWAGADEPRTTVTIAVPTARELDALAGGPGMLIGMVDGHASVDGLPILPIDATNAALAAPFFEAFQCAFEQEEEKTSAAAAPWCVHAAVIPHTGVHALSLSLSLSLSLHPHHRAPLRPARASLHSPPVPRPAAAPLPQARFDRVH